MAHTELEFEDKKAGSWIFLTLENSGDLRIDISNIIHMQDESCDFTLTSEQAEKLRTALNAIHSEDG